jgi:lysophospholipase L1-like esterase
VSESGGISARRGGAWSARARRWLVNLAVLAGAMALTFGALEIILRFAAHRVLPGGEWLSTASIFKLDDPPVGFSLKPNGTRILTTGAAYTVRDRLNSFGLNDAERSLEKPPGSSRILVLGDSFMFGQGVPRRESLPSRLDRLLPGVEVINAGIPGYGLEQEYLFYEDRGHRFDPDLLLLAFFFNDLQDPTSMNVVRNEDGLALAYHAKSEVRRRRGIGADRGIRTKLSAWLRSKSLLFTLVRSRIHGFMARRRHGDRPDRPRPDLEGTPEFFSVFLDEPGPDVMPRWERAFLTLDALERSAARRGAKLAIIGVPAPRQLGDEAFVQWAEFLNQDPAAVSRRKPFDMIAGWCERTGTPCLDLLDVFEGRDRDSLYFPHDMHWNADGHRLAAEAVHEFLLSLGVS